MCLTLKCTDNDVRLSDVFALMSIVFREEWYILHTYILHNIMESVLVACQTLDSLNFKDGIGLIFIDAVCSILPWAPVIGP